jgi:hypothetical protein
MVFPPNEIQMKPKEPSRKRRLRKNLQSFLAQVISKNKVNVSVLYSLESDDAKSKVPCTENVLNP